MVPINLNCLKISDEKVTVIHLWVREKVSEQEQYSKN